MARRVDCADDWRCFADRWQLAPGVTYLNHGSFGPPPRVVAEARADQRRHLDAQPMEFFTRRLEPAWFAARDRLADFVGASRDCLALVANATYATYAMNVVVDSFPLRSGDEVLLTNHAYGAVGRIWERACRRADGTGFLYAAPRWHGQRWHGQMTPPLLSWGRAAGERETWVDELLWSGARDYSGMLAIPAAIDFLARRRTRCGRLPP